MASAPPPSNRVAIWTDSALEPVEFLHAACGALAFAPHVHETYAIGIIEAGGQWFRPERRSALVMPQGTVCVVNPGTVHEGRGSDGLGWSYRMFYPSAVLVARALADDGQAPARTPSFDAHVIIDDGLYRQFLQLHQASRAGAPLLERQSRTLMFVRRLFMHHAGADGNGRFGTMTAGAAPRVAMLVREFLHAYCEQTIQIGDLAAIAGVSETQVIRAFSKAAGLPPHAYLIGLKVARARHLIRLGMPLAQASVQVGFADQSHLTRHFKRMTGQTPGQYAAGIVL